MKKISTILLSLTTFAFINCGGSGSSSNNEETTPDGTAKDPYKIQQVAYILQGSSLPTCNKASSITTSKAQKTDDIGVQTCTWFCGDYEGAKPITVIFTFIQYGKNNAWEFDDDMVTTAPQQCHN